MFIKIVNQVYAISSGKDRPISYLAKIDRDWIIVNAGVDDFNILINDILEITRGELPNYIFITSCEEVHARWASKVNSLSNAHVVAMQPDSFMLRHGECGGEAVPVSLEVGGREEVLGLHMIPVRTPTKGSYILWYDQVLFTGTCMTTPLNQNIKNVLGTWDILRS